MDLNADGHLDVVSGEYNPGHVNVWYGSAEGFGEKQRIEEDAFAEGGMDRAKERGVTVIMSTANFIDWDGDGDLDMVVGDQWGGACVALNEGGPETPRFGPRIPLQVAGAPLKTAGKSDPLPVDWDGDGRLDIVAGTEAGDVFFYRGLEDGSFAAPLSAITGQARPDPSYRGTRGQMETEGLDLGYRTRVETADWNNDGLLDLLVGNCRSVEGKGIVGHVAVYLRRPVEVEGL